MSKPDTFAGRLRKLREAARMSTQELGEAAGIGREAVWRLESGRRSPSWETVQALAEALGVPTDEFRAPG